LNHQLVRGPKVNGFRGLHTGPLKLTGKAKPSLQAFTNAVAGL
jgi:hypothetical protein